MNQIWVTGEALVDILPGIDQKVVVGGAAANTAKALGALEVDVQFIGPLSGDQYGALIKEELAKNKVNLDFAYESSLPTASAQVLLDDAGNASYKFNLENTATFSFDRNWLPIGNPKVLHIGSLATVIEPGASELFAWAKEKDCPIIFDPNIRGSIIKDRNIYLSRVLRWIQISKVIKLSEEDLSYLQLSVLEILELGAELVILTRGINGISAFTSEVRIDTPAYFVKVSDTVGAGDTVGAVVAEVLGHRYDLSQEHLTFMIRRASLASSITCSRQGASPPGKRELEG